MAKRHLLLAWLSAFAALLMGASIASATTMVVESPGVSGYDEIYSWSPGQSPGTNLTSNSGFDGYPDVSPDGTKIVFTSTRGGVSYGLYVMGSDGSNVTRVGSNINTSQASWSPDGTKIAYTYYSQLRIIDADGTNDHNVGSSSDVAVHPDWSPDGSTIVFSRYYSSRYQVVTIPSNGTSSTPPTVLTTPGSGTGDLSAVWSPDGNKIAFYSDRNGPGDIFTINPSGTGLAQITPGYNGSTYYCYMYPEWAAGGGALYFTRTTGPSCSASRLIYVMPASGGAPAQSSSGGYINLISIQQPVLPTLPTEPSYVAMGDSVASGEGINYDWVWDPSTFFSLYGSWMGGDTTPVWLMDPYSSDHQTCHQSLGGYPMLLKADLGVSSGDFGNFSCTGASAADGVLDDQSVAVSTPQLGFTGSGFGSPNGDFDTLNPDLVTLTVGADDVHFSDFVKACYKFSSPVECDTAIGDSQIASYLATQRTNLAHVLDEIHSRGAANGKVPLVVVTDYFNVFPEIWDVDCPDLSVSFGPDLTLADMEWLEGKLHKLNVGILEAASRYDNVVYVPLEHVFDGHVFCSEEDPWVYGISLRAVPGPGDNSNPAAFHPTDVGQEKIEAAILAAIG